MHKSQHIFLIVFIAIALVSLGLFALIFFSVKSLSNDNTNLRKEVADNQAKNEELTAIKSNLNSTLNDFETLTSVFVKDEGVVDFIESIESLAKTSGLKIEVSSVETAQDEKLSENQKEYLLVSTEVEGNWKDIIQFIHLIENMPYKVSLEKLEISANSATQGNNTEENVAKSALWEGLIVMKSIKVKKQ